MPSFRPRECTYSASTLMPDGNRSGSAWMSPFEALLGAVQQSSIWMSHGDEHSERVVEQPSDDQWPSSQRVANEHRVTGLIQWTRECVAAGVRQRTKGRLGDGAAVPRTRRNPSCPLPLESIAAAARPLALPSPRTSPRENQMWVVANWWCERVSDRSTVECSARIGQPASRRPSP